MRHLRPVEERVRCPLPPTLTAILLVLPDLIPGLHLHPLDVVLPSRALEERSACLHQSSYLARPLQSEWLATTVQHEVGSLEVGKFADFVVLDQDPLTVQPETLGSIAVLETWLGGEQVFNLTG